jgi:hypothetical protein
MTRSPDERGIGKHLQKAGRITTSNPSTGAPTVSHPGATHHPCVLIGDGTLFRLRISSLEVA